MTTTRRYRPLDTQPPTHAPLVARRVRRWSAQRRTPTDEALHHEALVQERADDLLRARATLAARDPQHDPAGHLLALGGWANALASCSLVAYEEARVTGDPAMLERRLHWLGTQTTTPTPTPTPTQPLP